MKSLTIISIVLFSLLSHAGKIDAIRALVEKSTIKKVLKSSNTTSVSSITYLEENENVHYLEVVSDATDVPCKTIVEMTNNAGIFKISKIGLTTCDYN